MSVARFPAFDLATAAYRAAPLGLPGAGALGACQKSSRPRCDSMIRSSTGFSAVRAVQRQQVAIELAPGSANVSGGSSPGRLPFLSTPRPLCMGFIGHFASTYGAAVHECSEVGGLALKPSGFPEHNLIIRRMHQLGVCSSHLGAFHARPKGDKNGCSGKTPCGGGQAGTA
jgi:hypothetical protein